MNLNKCMLSLLVVLSGCSLFSKEDTGLTETMDAHKEVFYYEYEKVWRATQVALAKYPIKLNDQDAGLLETEVIPARKIWTPPHKAEKHPFAHQYRLAIKAIKGKSQGRPAVQLRITKYKTRQKDFFSDSDRLPSDGLEEEMLLYRIRRELLIQKALDRAASKDNSF
ncbi:MAG: hypothetical protein CL675_04795 [Bdellovibrionaceae bacterium]|nr:hypothetical protein [Pseudobdellovibrionaceae bacterium]|tara:strand:+ start:695 stop:1195 length:501 start_codon:yes stop_codon:yes gene_type:complete